jgi:hypothetical protein
MTNLTWIWILLSPFVTIFCATILHLGKVGDLEDAQASFWVSFFVFLPLFWVVYFLIK